MEEIVALVMAPALAALVQFAVNHLLQWLAGAVPAPAPAYSAVAGGGAVAGGARRAPAAA